MEVSLRDAPPRLHNITLNTYAHIPPDMQGTAAAARWAKPLGSYRWCQSGAKEGRGVIWPFLILHVSPAKQRFSKVSDAGFEPATPSL